MDTNPGIPAETIQSARTMPPEATAVPLPTTPPASPPFYSGRVAQLRKDFTGFNTVCGHNMKDGSMFSGLREYRHQKFFDAHPYIEVTLLDKRLSTGGTGSAGEAAKEAGKTARGQPPLLCQAKSKERTT